jgi:predicted Zn-dependent protease
VIYQARFQDSAAAQEMFDLARKQPNPLKTLNADYGRFLLIVKRPRDAEAVLNQAIVDSPDFGDAWSNLAWARFQNGDVAGACASAKEALNRKTSKGASTDIAVLRTNLKCS